MLNIFIIKIQKIIYLTKSVSLTDPAKKLKTKKDTKDKVFGKNGQLQVSYLAHGFLWTCSYETPA